MPFKFKWDNPEKTVMRYSAEGHWNWNDYHKVTRASTFSMHQLSHTVDAFIDLRGGLNMPAGARAHIRTLVNRHVPQQSGRVVILGMPREIEAQVGAAERTLQINEGVIRFVDTEEQAYTVLNMWRTP